MKSSCQWLMPTPPRFHLICWVKFAHAVLQTFPKSCMLTGGSGSKIAILIQYGWACGHMVPKWHVPWYHIFLLLSPPNRIQLGPLHHWRFSNGGCSPQHKLGGELGANSTWMALVSTAVCTITKQTKAYIFYAISNLLISCNLEHFHSESLE